MCSIQSDSRNSMALALHPVPDLVEIHDVTVVSGVAPEERTIVPRLVDRFEALGDMIRFNLADDHRAIEARTAGLPILVQDSPGRKAQR